MELANAIELINTNKINSTEPVTWTDLGCGTGLFTHALSTLISGGSHIVAIDKEAAALKKVKVAEGVHLKTQKADFVHGLLPLENIEGVLMANALHYVRDKHAFLQELRSYTKPAFSFLLVEYDTDKPNPWVPFPLTVDGWRNFFQNEGFNDFELIARQPSVYGRAEMVGMHFR